MASKLVETAQSASKSAQAEVGAQVGKLIKKVQSRVQEVQGSLQATVQATVQTKVPQITDQMLLNLSHSGSQILQQTLHRIEQNPHDLVGRVGRAVLERAASVRAQMLESERVPQPVKKTLEEWGSKSTASQLASPETTETVAATTETVAATTEAAVEALGSVEKKSRSSKSQKLKPRANSSASAAKAASPKAESRSRRKSNQKTNPTT
jgi:hypothetical protein